MKDIKARMHHFILSNQLFEPDAHILLAVSGGMDSVCLAHLFKACKFNFSIAHCNFNLRGDDSDGDAQFVSNLANDLDVAHYAIDFETEAYANSNKLSIQMAARQLRYNWLEKIRSENNLDLIATAHHLNDSIETVLYNFSKGCGIRGLHGILPKKKHLIRPLLFASKTEIETFIKNEKISYREDVSNALEKYSRNFIRHQIIPKFKSLNPSFEQSAGETIRKIRETEWLFLQSIQQYKSVAVHQMNDELLIDLNEIPDAAGKTLLFEFLRPYGFNSDQVGMILDQQHQSGVFFKSNTHTLLIDRDALILRKTVKPVSLEYTISEKDEKQSYENIELTFTIQEGQPQSFSNEKEVAFFDYKKLKFPLLLRPWNAGDQFQPFGMQGKHQKIQDFLTHLKLTRFEKQQVYVMLSENQICWVMGLRIDERFKIDSNTEKHIRIDLTKK